MNSSFVFIESRVTDSQIPMVSLDARAGLCVLDADTQGVKEMKVVLG